MKKVTLLFVCCLVLLHTQAQDLKQLDTYLETLFKHSKIMGNLAISKDGQTIYNKSVGYQTIGNQGNTPITEQSKFRIGSITKTFTAVMIFQLIDEGKIEIDDKLSKYFPQLPNAENITIKNLLNHSSGLFDITQDENFNEQQKSTRNQMLEIINSHKQNFKAGRKHEYCNTNYLLLGYILEDIECLSYGEVLNNRIVKKLNLTNTYHGDVIDRSKNECLSYYFEDDASLHEANQADMSNPGGAGAIVSNPSDILVFINALFSGKLISKHSLDIMTTVKGEYGSGILSAKKNGMTFYAHNGTIDFFRSMYVYIPEHNIALALNTNALDYGMMPIMFTVVAALSGETIEIPTFNSIALSKEELEQFVGTYSSDELPFNLIFKTDGKVLKGAPEGSNLKELKPTSKNEFVLESMGVNLKFNLKNNTLVFKQAGESTKTLTKIN